MGYPMMVLAAAIILAIAHDTEATSTAAHHHKGVHVLRNVVGVRGGSSSGVTVTGNRLRGTQHSFGGAELSSKSKAAERVLILDVDGTLYGRSCGVEQQIVAGIHAFFGRELGLSPDDCDEIHHRYGSTVWGLQEEQRLTTEQVDRYYREVFSEVSLAGLYSVTLEGSSDDGDATGYQHRASAAAMIRGHRGPVFIASNSPLPHVLRVLAGVGLADIPYAGILTPDTRGGISKGSPEFYSPVLNHPAVEGRDIWLLDDSAVNLEVGSHLGMRTLLVGEGDNGASTPAAAATAATAEGHAALPLDRALACFVGAIPHPDDQWKFSDVQYLRSKNAVDKLSRSSEIWHMLEKQVHELGVSERDDKTLRVADIGCGLLPLLEDFVTLARECGAGRLEYCGLEQEAAVAREACKGLLSQGYTLDSGLLQAVPGKGVVGSETESWLLSRELNQATGSPETSVRIMTADFTSVDPSSLFPSGRHQDSPPNQNQNENQNHAGNHREHLEKQNQPENQNHHAENRNNHSENQKYCHHEAPDVIVGCCLADLLAPSALMRALLWLLSGTWPRGRVDDGGRSCLVYLPITFAGQTRMSPSAHQEGLIPSDESVLAAYDRGLKEQQGHHTDTTALVQAIRAHGGHDISLSPSPWRISRDVHPYLWDCLLYFVGLGLAPRPPPLPTPQQAQNEAGDFHSKESEGNGSGGGRSSDLAGWVQRARERSPSLYASNVDVLFRLGNSGSGYNVDVAATVPTPGDEHASVQRAPSAFQSAEPDLTGAGGAVAAENGKGTVAAGLRGGAGGGSWSIFTHSGKSSSSLKERVARLGTSETSAATKAAAEKGNDLKNKRDALIRTVLARQRGGAAVGGGSSAESDPDIPLRRENAYLEFVAPGKVEIRHEELGKGGRAVLGDEQILIQAVCSSISSGTELKVFRGDFDSDSELDTTIKGMAGEAMAYPLRYGYSLVGRVVECGRGVESEKLLGKLVFTFSPHCSWVTADADSVMIVPEGVEAEDAIYLPAVETALSLVHDVHPRVGESIAVFGQGMIGLLAVAILAETHGGMGGGSVVAVDMLADRLKVAERLGATASVTPQDAAELAPFDISLEVTGSPRGLQSALDLTGYGGRVVLGSWYGGGLAQLNLGMAFHRSHLTIQTSQVSRLPAGLTDRWDKDRRFAAAWSLVRQLRPSTFLTTSSPRLEGAQQAYEALGAGKELGVVFRYGG